METPTICQIDESYTLHKVLARVRAKGVGW